LRGDLPRWWAVSLVLAPWVQYGPLGVLLVPLLALLARSWHWEYAALAVVGVLLSQGSFSWAVAAELALAVASVLAAALWAGRRSVWIAESVASLPRVPRLFGYAFYPLHLLLLVALRAVVPAVPA